MASFKALLPDVLINCVSEVVLLPRNLKIFWSGLFVYFFSFLLLATRSSPPGDGRMPGFLCAFFAFVEPLNEAKLALFHNVPFSLHPVPYFSLLIAGWINPVFLVTAFLMLTDTHQRLVVILRVAVILMIPFSWLFFATFQLSYPREGHFVWVISMLLVLFSERLARAHFNR
jgi:hypothetical protein